MQRIICALLCLWLCGCGKTEPKVVVTPSLLAKIEKRLDKRIDDEATARSTEIGECKAGLQTQIDGVRGDLATHRQEMTSALQGIEQRCREEYARQLTARNGQGGGQELAYARQDSVPPPPREDPQVPVFDLKRFPIKDKKPNCMIIQDAHSGQWYRWNFQRGQSQLAALYQNGCNCGKHWSAVGVDFQGDRIVFPNGATVMVPGFPTP